jgi:hypothetical protein
MSGSQAQFEARVVRSRLGTKRTKKRDIKYRNALQKSYRAKEVGSFRDS